MKYFDLHCDTLTFCLERGETLTKNSLQLSLRAADCFDSWRQCFAIWKPDDLSVEEYSRLFKRAAAHFEGCAPKDMLLTVENGEFALLGEFTPELLAKRYNIRMMSLTWNAQNRLACGSACKSGGLSQDGKRLLREMQRYGIAIDVSHLNAQSLREVLRFTDEPVVASHSNAFALCEHERNLPGDCIKEIISRGGLIGLCYYQLFLGEHGSFYDSLYAHMEHILSLGGENTLALGSDFDGCGMDECIDSVEKVPALYGAMLEKGIDKATLDKIFFSNADRFFEANR